MIDWKAVLSQESHIEISRHIGYTFTREDLEALAMIHRDGMYENEILSLLRECNYKQAANDFEDHHYFNYAIF